MLDQIYMGLNYRKRNGRRRMASDRIAWRRFTLVANLTSNGESC